VPSLDIATAQRVRGLFDEAPFGVIVLDDRLRIVDCTARFLEILGAPRASVIGFDLSAARDGALSAVLRAALGGEPGTYEGAYTPTVTGEPRLVRNVCWPLRDDAGIVVGVLLAAEDVAARHEAQAALATSEEQHRRVLDLVPDPILVRIEGRFVWVNMAAVRLFGAATREELIGRSTAEFVPPETLPAVNARILEALTGPGTDFLAQRFVRLDGTIGVAEVASFATTYDGRRALLSVARDLTDRLATQAAREAAEEARRAADQRGHLQFQAIPVPTYAWQRVERDGEDDFVLVDHNRAAAKITDGAIQTMRGKGARALFHERPHILADLVAAFRDGVSIHRDMDHTLSNGKRRKLSVDYIPTSSDLVLVYTEDVTDRVALEEQLRQAQKMEAIGQLAAGVAHDFNNLLTVIDYCAQSIREGLDPASELGADAVELEKAAARAATLTKQLLTFSRRQHLEPRDFDVDVVLGGLEAMLRRLIGESVRCELSTGQGPLHVRADPGQFEQAIMNLAVNARDAMPEGGSLRIETGRVEVGDEVLDAHLLPPGSYVRIGVRDTGIGMDAATRARIFEPFFTTKAIGRGTGLGLATVYGIVRQSGGTIRVESEPGCGTYFEILMPASTPSGALHSPQAGDDRRGDEVVLIVEDDDTVRAITQRVLERAGYRVFSARDGRQGLALADGVEGPIDLLVTDLVMPVLGGRDLYAALAARRPAMCVLFMSGHGDNGDLARPEPEARTSFLQKPFSPATLRTRVRALLDARPR
jgi:PAS domain S-box-containing protein